MCTSGTGWSLFAGQSEEAVRKVIHRTNLKLGKNEARIEYDAMQKRLREVRRHGYASSKGSVTPGAGVIAMAFPQTNLGAPLAIGVAGVLERLEPLRAEIVKTLRSIIDKHATANNRGT